MSSPTRRGSVKIYDRPGPLKLLWRTRRALLISLLLALLISGGLTVAYVYSAAPS